MALVLAGAVLQPPPRGLRSCCAVQRVRATLRTYFRMFLQEQRPI
ncbi:unnamed protein product, partial [Phaeothamnion confervicola]